MDFADGAPPCGIAPRVRVVLEDQTGRRAGADVDAHSAALFAPAGHESRRVALNQVRSPFDAFGGADLASVAAVELQLRGATPGAVHVADLAALDLV